MKRLVCLSDVPWRAAPSRTQQLLTRLRGVDILFFEPPAPGAGRPGQRGRRVRANVIVYGRPALPPERGGMPILRRRGQAKQAAFLLGVMEQHRFREPLLWTTTPEDLFLVDALPHRGLIYDCSREWDALPLEWESELAARADVCFAASPGLADRLSPCCDNIAVIPNGVNYLIFSQPGQERPAGLRGISGPILIRVGELPRDLDVEPVCHAASRRPLWHFVFLGRAAPAVARKLERYPNIHLPGSVSADQVPDYLAASDICFDLISRRMRGCDVIPSHAFEYMALGKPIVAMLDYDQVETFPDVVYTAHDPAGFLDRCEHALREAPGWVSGRRKEYASKAQWSDRAEEIERILETTGLF